MLSGWREANTRRLGSGPSGQPLSHTQVGDRGELNPHRRDHSPPCFRYTTVTVRMGGIGPLVARLSAECSAIELHARLCPGTELNRVLPGFSGTLSPHKLPGQISGVGFPAAIAAMKLSVSRGATPSVAAAGLEPAPRRSKLLQLPLLTPHLRCPTRVRTWTSAFRERAASITVIGHHVFVGLQGLEPCCSG